MRTLLLLLVMAALLAGSLRAVAHVDVPPPCSTSSAVHASDAGHGPTDRDHGVAKHCDLCSHGLGHLTFASAIGPSPSGPGTIYALPPAIPRAVGTPDRQDRPPK